VVVGENVDVGEKVDVGLWVGPNVVVEAVGAIVPDFLSAVVGETVFVGFWLALDVGLFVGKPAGAV